MNDKEKVAQWMIKQGFATGHGDSIEDLLKELDEQIGRRMVRQRNNFGKVLLKAVADEREACAKLVEADGIAHGVTRDTGLVLVKNANRIRARGKK